MELKERLTPEPETRKGLALGGKELMSIGGVSTLVSGVVAWLQSFADGASDIVKVAVIAALTVFGVAGLYVMLKLRLDEAKE